MEEIANLTTTSLKPIYTNDLLQQISEISFAASIMPINKTYFPLSPLTLIHAIIVSHNSLLILGFFTHNKGRINLITSIAFNQILLFGPLTIISLMLVQPCPILIAPEIILIYAGIHFLNVISGLGLILINLTQFTNASIIIDSIFLLVDAFVRMDGIVVLGIETVKNHSNPLISNSSYVAILIGWSVGVGSILMIGIISFEFIQWTLRTPTWLQNPEQLLGVDYISSFLATIFYYYFTISRKELFLTTRNIHQHPYLQSFLPIITNILQFKSITKQSTDLHSTNLLSSTEAKAFGAILIFTFSFGNRLKVALINQLANNKSKVKRSTITNKSSKTVSSPTNNSKPSSTSTTTKRRKTPTKE